MRTIRFNNNRRISSSLFLRKEGRRETSVSNASGDKILKGKVPFLLLFFLLFLGSCSSDFLDNKPTDAVDSGLPCLRMPNASLTVRGTICSNMVPLMPTSAIVL